MPKKLSGSLIKKHLVLVESIDRHIYVLRNRRVMLDADLAELYQVPTFRLNEAVKRNRKRFPEDFMFKLTRDEAETLTSQNAMSNGGRGGRRTSPYAFSEHGVAMLSSVLKSDRAVQMNISIIRAFIKLRDVLATHNELSGRMEKMEATQKRHTSVITILAEEIETLKQPRPLPPKRRIGFTADQH